MASAKASLEVAYKNSVGEISAQLSDELMRLAKAGQTIFPSAIPSKFVNSDGDEVTITWTQQQNAKKFYSRANSAVAKVITTKEYKALSDAEKESVIRSIYTAYRSASLAKAIGDKYDSSLTRMAMYAKTGDAKFGSIVMAVRAINKLEATKTKTRKELAVSYVNKLGLSRGEKLIALRMAGFGVDNSSLISALRSKGLSKKEAEAFAG